MLMQVKMSERVEIGGIKIRHRGMKRKKNKSKKGKREGIFDSNGSGLSDNGMPMCVSLCMFFPLCASLMSTSDFLLCSPLPDYTLSEAMEGKKRKKHARTKKEKTKERNVPAEPEHGLLTIHSKCSMR